jgi:hypothetical protein
MARGRFSGVSLTLLLMVTAGGCAQRRAAVAVQTNSNPTKSVDGAYERQACVSDATCEWPYGCVDGACVLQGGENCERDSQCSSGQCTWGVCSFEL